MTPSLENRLPARLAKYASQLFAAELCFNVDPYVMAAILERESLGGDALTPKGPGGTGDKGRGHGLMQIDSGYHGSFLKALGPDKVELWKDPTFNIMYAAKLLRQELNVFRGHYAAAICAYNAGPAAARRALVSLPENATIEDQVQALDQVTANKSYVSSVLRARDKFLSDRRGN